VVWLGSLGAVRQGVVLRNQAGTSQVGFGKAVQAGWCAIRRGMTRWGKERCGWAVVDGSHLDRWGAVRSGSVGQSWRGSVGFGMVWQSRHGDLEFGSVR
jgi:hypothetical protein